MTAELSRRGRFLAVAVCKYTDESWETLEGARAATDRLATIMEVAGYDVLVLTNPSYAEVASKLDGSAWREQGFRGPLVLVWVGHGESLNGALGLAVADTPRGKGIGLRHQPSELARFSRESGSLDTLLLFDTCSAGAGDSEVLLTAIRSDNESTSAGSPPRLGVAVSSKAYERALDGAFVSAFADLLTHGPGSADEAGQYAPLWSASYETVPVGAVLFALLKRKIAGQNQRSWPAADSTIPFPNPKFVANQAPAFAVDRLAEIYPEVQVDTTIVDTPAIQEVCARIDKPDPGLWLLVGSAGAGKSTCLTQASKDAQTETTVVHAARGLRAVQHDLARFPTSPVLLDSFDEAPMRDLEAIIEVAIRASRDRLVVVATRPAALDAIRPGEAGRSLIGVERVIELDTQEWLRPTLVRYVVQRLRGAL